MKRKILFIIPSLKAGGAERVISFLVRKLDKSKFHCRLLVLGFKENAVYQIGDSDVIYLNKPRLLKSISSIVDVILKEKPNIVFSSIGHVNVLMGILSFFFMRIKFIAREASVMTTINRFGNKKKQLPPKHIKLLYSRFSKVVCQSNDMKNDFIINFKLAPNKLKVINNPITSNIEFIDPINYDEVGVDIKFITIGRLSKEKGHERILKGLSKINDYSYNYLIIGSGALEESIKNLAEELGIDGNIKYIPFTDQVLDYLSGSDCFIQGSYVEGFPNALLESCSVGTPAIAFNCPGGTKEIIENGVNGYLVDGNDEFEDKLLNIKEVISTFDRVKVQKSVEKKFSPEIILSEYINLFLSV